MELERLRDSLVHMLVHDLRTPLTGLKLYLELMRQSASGRDDSGEFGALVTEAGAIADHMTAMINDLLDTSRFEEGAMPLTMAEVDLAELVREAVTVVTARGHHRTVQVAVPSPLPAWGDAGVLRRVVVNLVGNALDYSPDDSPVGVAATLSDHAVELRVSDRGPGIPEAYRELIFEKFGQIDAARHHVKHSSGLGLTFCRLALVAHGGRIGVDSDPGSGSTFWFVLPRKAHDQGDDRRRPPDIP